MPNERVVYIVEDDNVVRRSATFMLRHAGFQVTTIESGIAFMKIAKKAKPGCVLLDIRMPGMNGLEVQQKMIENDIDMPVIVLTGHGDIAIAVQCMRLGAINFFEKPYKKESLLEALDEAFLFLENPELRFMAASQARVHLACLNGRERDVLDGLMNGNPNKAIAHDLDTSLRSVEISRANILEKLRVKGIAQALRIGFAAAARDPVIAHPIRH